jgi:hypothetical protein
MCDFGEVFMRRRFAWFLLTSVLLLTLPAFAQYGTDVYDNGPINGTTDGWTINFGYVVSDSFILDSATNVAGIQFGAWLYPGDVLVSAEVSITSSEFGGTSYFDQVVNFTQSTCFSNEYGFNVCTESGSFSQVNLSAGTYWLNLANASVNTGDPIFWDENSGPSQASESSVGTIPSESFTILGNNMTTITCGSPAGCGIPEPSTITLSTSGTLTLFAALGALRRKFF